MTMKKGLGITLFNNLGHELFVILLLFVFLEINACIAVENYSQSISPKFPQIKIEIANASDDQLRQLITTCVATSIGVIIGGFFTFFSTKKQLESQSRIAYISNILKDERVEENLGRFLIKLNIINKNEDIINQLTGATKDMWFFLLFSPSKKRYEMLDSQIRNKKWIEALNTISEFLRGNW